MALVKAFLLRQFSRMITTEHELREAVATAGTLLQDISDYANANPQSPHNVQVRFPRGFLRTNYEARQSFAFVDDKTLRSNISYAIMAHDVLRWLIQRTDLSGQAKCPLLFMMLCKQPFHIVFKSSAFVAQTYDGVYPSDRRLKGAFAEKLA